jgi:hypothetical protein
MLRNKTPFFHKIMDTPSNPSFFWVETLNKCHITMNISNKKEGINTYQLPPPRKPTIGPKWYL